MHLGFEIWILGLASGVGIRFFCYMFWNLVPGSGLLGACLVLPTGEQLGLGFGVWEFGSGVWVACIRIGVMGFGF